MGKNILLLDTGKEWGGGTNSLLELLKRVNRDNYKISALFYTNFKYGKESDIKTEIEKLGFKFLILPQRKQSTIVKILKEVSRTIFFFSKTLKRHCIFFIDYNSRIRSNAKRIAGILKNQQTDLFYLNNQPSSNLEGILASEITGIPALLHARIESNLNFVEIKASNRSLSKIICVSDGVRSGLIKQGIDSSKCVVVHNGISDKTKPATPSREIKARWGISDNDILIGSVGSIIKRKRFNDMIDAVHLVRTKTDCQFKCLIVGEGSELDNLRKMAKSKNLDDIVLFTGFQTDAISYTNAMDLFILTSEKEGLPRVILEAMLMEKPREGTGENTCQRP